MNEKIETTVNQWFFALIHNSPISRETDIYNYISQAKDALIEHLQSELSKEE